MAMHPSPSCTRYLWAGGALFVLILLTVFLTRPCRQPKEPDMTAVFKANLRGVGYMEQFEYARAVDAFEEVRRLAPAWWPGQVNMGIALLNQAGTITPINEQQDRERRQVFQRAINLFQDVLARHSESREAQASANYCLAVIYQNLGMPARRYRPYLERVLELDSEDADSWFRLGLTLTEKDPRRAADCFSRAMRLNPYLRGAAYNFILNSYVREHEPDRRAKALAEFESMDRLKLYNAAKERYTELGKYCEVIGRGREIRRQQAGPLPWFAPPAAPACPVGPRHALGDGGRPCPWGGRGVAFPAAQRFGGVLVTLDYNGDGKSDLFLLGAVVRQGKVGNLLFCAVTARGTSPT